MREHTIDLTPEAAELLKWSWSLDETPGAEELHSFELAADALMSVALPAEQGERP